MQGKCKTYLVWEGFPKLTMYLKNAKQSGEKVTFQVGTSILNHGEVLEEFSELCGVEKRLVAWNEVADLKSHGTWLYSVVQIDKRATYHLETLFGDVVQWCIIPVMILNASQ